MLFVENDVSTTFINRDASLAHMSENLHIAIIMDGNRRWAEANHLNRLEGHRHGAKKLEELVEWCRDAKARALTLYAFSTENFRRAPIELKNLFDLFREFFVRLAKKAKELGLRIIFLGRLALFPRDIQNMAKKIEQDTIDGSFPLRFCFGYGGRQEILDAVNKAIRNGNELTEEGFEKLLYMEDQPDIVIRTGGAVRTSNFLPWQTAYAEWFFVDTYWPDFSNQEFHAIIAEFDQRKRNFGK
ncbi:MAG: tritrans,polycis-undecaprenyl-diphosphate synthase geranylgeranyl-diphosphate specific [archaeon GW2011_AR4]|nr:MAG: tritrans,polycis-undecaprenyl-diphosphate synthase geranylgeranyl-diphosphate specific [archaeon GW2011_AR4]